MTLPLDPYPWTTRSPAHVAPRFAKRPHNHPDGSPAFRPRSGYEQNARLYPTKVLMGASEQKDTTVNDDIEQYLTPMDNPIAEPTDAEVEAFTEAWELARQKIGRGIARKGTKTRAGLRAAYAARKARLRAAAEESNTAREPARLVLDERPWVILTKMFGREAGSRFANSGNIPSNVTFRFEPRAEFEQDPAQYPEKRYGPHIRKVQEDRLPDLTDSTALDERERTPLQQDTEKQMVPQALVEAIEKETEAQGDRISLWAQAMSNQEAIRRAKITSAKITTTASGTRIPVQTAEGLRTNALSLLALVEPSEHTDPAEVRRCINELAALAEAPKDITDGEIYGERQHQISQGYSASHDDEHGIRHLLLWAIQYGKQHKSVESLALIRAALESMARRGIDL